MKQILLAIILIMNFHQSVIGQANHTTDSCTGIVSIYSFYQVDTIPLYTQANGTPFDVLKLKKKRIGWSRYYTVRSNLGERFAPYELIHAEHSAIIAKSNRRIMSSKNNWVRSHLKPKEVYKLSFKLIGRYDEWLKVELNSKTREVCYIRRNDSYMYFQSWEDIVKPALALNFSGLPVYDKPNGNEIVADDKYKHSHIIAIEGDWMNIRYHNGSNHDGCWIKWKDETGMLVTNLIYEFIQ